MKSVQKGKGSPRKVLKALGDLLPQVEALHGAEEHIQQSFALAMRDVAPDAFRFFDDAERRKDVILRAGRRRVAALMDDLSARGDRLASWEQYLSPPIGPNIQLGDILMKADGEKNDPVSFRLVLTPSCDLVASDGREQKVDNVLVARCCSMKDGLDRTSLKGMKLSKLKDRLSGTVLSQGYIEAIVPFPCLNGQIPTMAADLRDLELIPFDEIDISNTAFLRIASIYSPFRELIACAFVHIACRPGVPDRDLDSWRDEIIAVVKDESGNKKI